MSNNMEAFMMKLIVVIMVISSFPVMAQTKMVRAYVKSNGTYVAPHIRTAPNGNPYDNIKPKK